MAFTSSSARADTAVWTSNTGGSFNTPSFWLSGSTPATTDIIGTPTGDGNMTMNDSPDDPAARTVVVAGVDVNLSAFEFDLLSQSSGVNNFHVTGDVIKTGAFQLLIRNGGSGTAQLDVTIDGALELDGGPLNFGDKTNSLNQLTVGGLTRVASGTMNFISPSVQLNGGLDISSGGRVNVFNQITNPGSGGITVSTLTGSSGATLAASGTNSSVVGTLVIGGNSGTSTYSGALIDGSGKLNVTKSGSSVQVFDGVSTYTGTTTVSAGTLLINGSLGATTVTVGAQGTLSGSGTIGGTVSVDGTLAPGTLSTLTINNSLTLGAGAKTMLSLGGAGTFDRIALTGVGSNLTLDGTITLVLVDGYVPVSGDSFDLLDWTGVLTASDFDLATDLILPTLGDGLGWDTSSFLTDGVVSVGAVPEPQTYALLGSGLAILVISQRRKIRAQAS